MFLNMHPSLFSSFEQYSDGTLAIIIQQEIKELPAQIVGAFIQKHTFRLQLPSFPSPWHSGLIRAVLV